VRRTKGKALLRPSPLPHHHAMRRRVSTNETKPDARRHAGIRASHRIRSSAFPHSDPSTAILVCCGQFTSGVRLALSVHSPRAP
jgi:hypothetical protein